MSGIEIKSNGIVINKMGRGQQICKGPEDPGKTNKEGSQTMISKVSREIVNEMGGLSGLKSPSRANSVSLYTTA